MNMPAYGTPLAPGQETAALPFSRMQHEPGSGTGPNPQGSHLRWTRTPRLRRPVLIAAFEGWNDAGDAASTAVRHIRDRLMAQLFAGSTQEFFDFTSTRPSIEIVDGTSRRLSWPTTELAANDVLGDGDVVTLVANEPQLKWRTYCNEIIDVARAIDARLVVVLGALLAEVAHTRPTEVFGTSYDTELADDLGPDALTTKVPPASGVLHAARFDAGIPSVSPGRSPSYVAAPSPRLRSPSCAASPICSHDRAGDRPRSRRPHERQVSRLVSEDEEIATYVAQLEVADAPDDDDDTDAGCLVESR
jgi:hypothetical protein